tara:strand:- start:9632 stop:9826 length:195 start_codon:yes stop_codon:yes gene_type:complete
MKTLKQILTEMRSKAVESAELGYNNVWIRRSKQDPENSNHILMKMLVLLKLQKIKLPNGFIIFG